MHPGLLNRDHRPATTILGDTAYRFLRAGVKNPDLVWRQPVKLLERKWRNPIAVSLLRHRMAVDQHVLRCPVALDKVEELPIDFGHIFGLYNAS